MLALSLAMLAVCLSSCSVVAQGENQDKVPIEAEQLQLTAANMQRDKEFALAIEKWKELLAKHPDTAISNKARHNLGICYQAEKQYKNAIDVLEQAISKASRDNEIDVEYLPETHLFKAFCEYSLAKTETDEAKAAKLFDTSIKSYDQILAKFPEDKITDQAHFFKGEAQYYSGNIDQAIVCYQKVVSDFPASKQHEIAARNLNVSFYEIGDFENTIKSGEDYLTAYPKGDWADQIRINIPTAEIQTALALANSGDLNQSNSLFKSAEKKLADLVANEQYSGRDEALYKQAFCVMRQQRFGEAAKLFADLVETHADSERAEEAAISAGRFYFKAGDFDQASIWLARVEQANNQYSPEATHWLCRIGLEGTDFESVFDKAIKAYESDKKAPIAFSFLFDAGDALFKIPARQQDAAKYYLQAANEFPDNERVAEALYNAAFIHVNLKEIKESIALTDRFEKDFPDSEFYPDMLEIKAEALLMSNDAMAAEKIYKDIIARFSTNSNVEKWNTQIGLARTIQNDHDGVIAWLRPIVDQFKQPESKTEALYRIAFSQFQLGQFDKAAEAASGSIAVGSQWQALDDVYLLLGRSQSKQKELDKALETFADLKSKFANSRLLDEVDFRIGEAYFDQGQYDKARKHYQSSINVGNSFFEADAMYGIAWIDMMQEDHKAAVAQFDQLIEKFPKHALTIDAIGNRGRALRQLGDYEKALKDFELYLKAEGITQENKIAMTYEQGLSEVGLKRWDEAVDTFSTLVEIAPDSMLADTFHFELGWAYKNKGDENASFESFEALVKQFPNSSLAAESNFQVAINNSRNKKYESAIEGFSNCIAGTQSDSLKEKALFNLAWSHFHLKQFDQAKTVFERQAKDFPNGELAADAYWMIGESLFSSNQHEFAVTAYKAAIPEIKRSATASPGIELSSRLHGAQSANKSNDYQAALEFAEPIIENNAEWEFAPESWFEIGSAHYGLGDNEKAIEAWENAASTFNQVGARARFMIGESLMGQKKFDEAIQQFKLVIYGYGGDLANDQVKIWQSNSAYEAARCSFVRIDSTEDATQKKKLIEDATKMYEFVVNKFPECTFVADAKKSLKTLESLK